MSVKEQSANFSGGDGAATLVAELKTKEDHLAAMKEAIDVPFEARAPEPVTTGKEAIDAPPEMSSDDSVVIPFRQRRRRKHVDKAYPSQNQKVILPFEKKGEYFVEPLGEIAPKTAYNVAKRIFDIFVSAAALIVLAIPMAIIAVMIKIKSPGPVLYHQERLGLCGKKIDVVKFRTMDVNAEATGAQWSQGDDDPRIFPFGRTLRKTRLDELPQLAAVFTGRLSCVGPRPEREIFYNEFETYIHGFHERLKVKPGLTGLAQVNGGYDLKPEEKIIWDVEYIKHCGLMMDLRILFKTVAVVLKHDGAK